MVNPVIKAAFFFKSTLNVYTELCNYGVNQANMKSEKLRYQLKLYRSTYRVYCFLNQSAVRLPSSSRPLNLPCWGSTALLAPLNLCVYLNMHCTSVIKYFSATNRFYMPL